MRVGVISDTHNLLRREALEALRGVDRILHGGDVCRPEVLAGLEVIAPVTAVRGNNDRGGWVSALPEAVTVVIEGVRVYVVHDRQDLRINPVAEGIAVVVSGHSHRPSLVERDGVIWLNPGSAGPRRFKLPISLTILHIDGGSVRAELVTLG